MWSAIGLTLAGGYLCLALALTPRERRGQPSLTPESWLRFLIALFPAVIIASSLLLWPQHYGREIAAILLGLAGTRVATFSFDFWRMRHDEGRAL